MSHDSPTVYDDPAQDVPLTEDKRQKMLLWWERSFTRRSDDMILLLPPIRYEDPP